MAVQYVSERGREMDVEMGAEEAMFVVMWEVECATRSLAGSVRLH